LLDLSNPFPILCNDKGKPYGWYWDPGASANLPAITLAEALSLRLVEDLLKPLLPQAILTSLQAHFNQAQAKLKTLQQDNAVAHWQDKVRHVPPALPLLPPSIDADVLDTVQQALLYDQQVEVDYETAHADKHYRQTLHPLALVQRGPITYLVATAFNYQDIRLYALHRMHNATASDQPVKRPADFNLDAYIASGALQFGEGTLQLKAWVSADLADYLSETWLSKDQTLQAVDDGYQLTTTVSDSWQLRWWIRSQGTAIVVLDPVGLREEILEDLKATLNSYSE
jgi:predicted DNA-binding transcriptional regulator YafY